MKNKQLVLGSIALVVFASLSRLVSHPMNFTPITALILFSVFAFEGKWKVIVPVVAILLSDVALEVTSGIGFHSGTWLVYSGYALIAIIGYLLIKNASALRLLSCTILGSVSFFLLTNFALFYPVAAAGKENYGYTHDLTGISASYTAGIPFFRNMLMGDLIYTAVLFGAYFLVKRFFFKPHWLSKN